MEHTNVLQIPHWVSYVCAHLTFKHATYIL